jgi:hypothetical protein
MKSFKYHPTNIHQLVGARGKYAYCHTIDVVKPGNNEPVMIQVCDKNWNAKPNCPPAIMSQDVIGWRIIG